MRKSHGNSRCCVLILTYYGCASSRMRSVHRPGHLISSTTWKLHNSSNAPIIPFERDHIQSHFVPFLVLSSLSLSYLNPCPAFILYYSFVFYAHIVRWIFSQLSFDNPRIFIPVSIEVRVRVKKYLTHKQMHLQVK